MTADVVIAARRHLAASSDPTDLLGSGQGYDTWIFPGQDSGAAPHVPIEGTGEAAIVIWASGGWTSPNRHNTMWFPRLFVDVYVDPERDAGNNIQNPYVRDRLVEIWTVVDSLLHYPQAGEITWDDMRILSSVKAAEWEVRPFKETDGAVFSAAMYSVAVG